MDPISLSRRQALAVAVLPVIPFTPARPVDSVLEWYDICAATVAESGFPTQVMNSRIWAIAWLAAARATRAVRQGREVALAASLHHVLATLVPGQQANLDVALARTLDRLPPDEMAIQKARAVAGVALAEREGDGLDLESLTIPFTPPSAEPGIWRPTPPAFRPAVLAGLGRARPFLLGSPGQFRPQAPPALDSVRYRRDLDEVRLYGVADGSPRTPEQTDTALFWAQTSLIAYTSALRAAVAQSCSFGRRVVLVAIFHAISIDAQIAVFEAKYAYVWWRPITALRLGGYPDWTALVNTPPFPEYPSGHTIYAGAAETTLTALVGPGTAKPFTLTSPTAPGVTRTYRAWRELTRDNVNARVWSGIHFRNSDEVGAEQGRRVARYGLARAGRLI